jgi:pyruvate formate lyase activating enzyme
LQKAKESGLHVCIETCGHASAEAITALSPFVDVFLFDYKETDPARHKAYTGVDNSRILENLALLDRLGKTVVLRCPIIPGYNDRPDHFKGIADVANTYAHVTEVVVEPYHALGSAKYTRLGRAYTLANVPTPDKETVLGWVAAIGAHTHKTVRSAIEY